MTDQGKLTITFSKPVIMPNIRVESETNNETTRLLSGREYEIEEVLLVSVDSAFHEEGSSETKIEDYKLTKLTD